MASKTTSTLQPLRLQSSSPKQGTAASEFRSQRERRNSKVGQLVSTLSTVTQNLNEPSRMFRSHSKRRIVADAAERMIDSNTTQCMLAVCLAISLFFPDTYAACSPDVKYDDIFDGIEMFIFVVFCLECTTLVVCKKAYFNGFFFWMDILGTLSIILDIHWFNQSLGFNSGDVNLLRAARSAKLGARSGRIAKVFRVVEMFFFRSLTPKGSSNDVKVPPAKAVGKALSGVLSRRVAALVMILIIILPLLTYQAQDQADRAIAETIGAALTFSIDDSGGATTTNVDLQGLAVMVWDFYKGRTVKPLSMSIQPPGEGVEPTVFDWESKVGYCRPDNQRGARDSTGAVSLLYCDAVDQRLQSISSVATIAVVLVVLVGFSASFQQSVDVLVVLPLERMMDTMKTSASSMLKSLQGIAHERSHVEGPDGDKVTNTLENEVDDEMSKILETDLLENMVAKLARITALVLPGNQLQYVDDKAMDQNTKDWIQNEYLNDTSSSKAKPTLEQLNIADPRAKDDTNENATFRSKTRSTTVVNQRTGHVVGSGVNHGQGGRSPKPQYRSTVVVRKSFKPTYEEQEILQLATAEAIEAEINADQLYEELANVIESWSFDVEALDSIQTKAALNFIFETFDSLEECRIAPSTMSAFVSTLQNRYLAANTYHNWKHAVDVTHTVYKFVIDTQAHVFFVPLETFSVLIAALAHDVGHPGVSNAYLVKTRNELAIIHNDQSPLENMHVATLYQIVSRPGLNIFEGLDPDQWRAMRKLIISAILGTDMIHHFPLISKLQVFYELNARELTSQIANGTCNAENAHGMKEVKERSFIIDVFLHAADISNPVKSFDICQKWANFVVAEFFAQGDLEKASGLDVSPMMDRVTTNVPNMQIGFIEFVVFPLYDAFVRTFPPLEPLIINLVNNQKSWMNIRREDLTKSEKDMQESEKLNERLFKMETKVVSILDEVGPMARKIEQLKLQFEEMLKLVDHNSAILSSAEETFSPAKRMMTKKLIIKEISLREEREDEARSSMIRNQENDR